MVEGDGARILIPLQLAFENNVCIIIIIIVNAFLVYRYNCRRSQIMR